MAFFVLSLFDVVLPRGDSADMSAAVAVGAVLIFGGGGANILLGGPGNDLLIGGLGRDLLIGGTGHDVLLGLGGDE